MNQDKEPEALCDAYHEWCNAYERVEQLTALVGDAEYTPEYWKPSSIIHAASSNKEGKLLPPGKEAAW